jgi:hypothetical protein
MMDHFMQGFASSRSVYVGFFARGENGLELAKLCCGSLIPKLIF